MTGIHWSDHWSFRQFFQKAHDDVGQRSGNIRYKGLGPDRYFMGLGVIDGSGVFTMKGVFAGDHFIKDQAEAVKITPGVNRLALDLFRAHIPG